MYVEVRHRGSDSSNKKIIICAAVTKEKARLLPFYVLTDISLESVCVPAARQVRSATISTKVPINVDFLGYQSPEQASHAESLARVARNLAS